MYYLFLAPYIKYKLFLVKKKAVFSRFKDIFMEKIMENLVKYPSVVEKLLNCYNHIKEKSQS